MLNFFLCAYFACCGKSDWLKNVIPVFIVSCISYETRKLVSSDLTRRYATVNGGASERYDFNPIVTIQKRDGLHLVSICLFNVDLTLPLTLPCTVLRQGLLQPWRMVVWRSWRGILDTTLCDKVCQWLAAGRWFSPCTMVSSINKTDPHDIAEILLKVALNTHNPNHNINISNKSAYQCMSADYWADDTIGDWQSTGRDIDQVIIIKT